MNTIDILLTTIAFIPLVLSIIALILSMTYAYRTISSRKRGLIIVSSTRSNQIEDATLIAKYRQHLLKKHLFSTKNKPVPLNSNEEHESSLFSKEFN